MASFMKEMKEKILVSIVALTYITSFITVDGKAVLNGDNITFSALRQGSNYTLKKSKNDWFLASYDTIAEAVVLSVNYSPPYGKLCPNVFFPKGAACLFPAVLLGCKK